MTLVKILCPICNDSLFIQVSEDVVRRVQGGVTTVSIREGQLCSHSFIVYIDSNYQVRDYVVTDFDIKIPQIEFQAPPILNSNIIKNDVYLIKINLLPRNFSIILKGLFFGIKILYLTDSKFLKSHIKNFFHQLCINTFDIEFSVQKSSIYKTHKNLYKYHLVLNDMETVQDNYLKDHYKKIKIEDQIIHNFFNETEPTSSLILLRNEVQKAFHLSKSIKDFFINNREKKKINILDIVKDLENKFTVNISIEYIEWLLLIVKNYFKTDIPIICKSLSDFL